MACSHSKSFFADECAACAHRRRVEMELGKQSRTLEEIRGPRPTGVKTDTVVIGAIIAVVAVIGVVLAVAQLVVGAVAALLPFVVGAAVIAGVVYLVARANADRAVAERPTGPIPVIAAVPMGWYSDPATGRFLRWWDGTAWTDHTRAF